jgi:hypothetical protein
MIYAMRSRHCLILTLLALSCSENGPISVLPSDASSPIVLASGQDQPWALTVDEDSVIWVNAGVADPGVFKVSKTGGPRVTLYQGPVGEVESIAVDATSVYFPTKDSIMAVPRSGGIPRALAATGRTRGVAIVNGEVYWVESSPPMPEHQQPIAKRVPTNGGTPTPIDLTTTLPPISDSAYVTSSAADGVFASIAPGGGILWLPTSGAPTFAPGVSDARSVAADQSTVYFTTGQGLHATARGAGVPRRIFSSSAALGVAVDESSVFVTEMGPHGSVRRVSKADSTVLTVASDQDAAHAVAVDAQNVYWDCINEGAIKTRLK